MDRESRERNPVTMTNEQFPMTEEGFELRFRERPSQKLTIELPSDVVASLERVAASRDMSVDALIRFYIGQNLRLDIAILASVSL